MVKKNKKERITRQLRISQKLFEASVKKLVCLNPYATFADLIDDLLLQYLGTDNPTLSSEDYELYKLNVFNNEIEKTDAPKNAVIWFHNLKYRIIKMYYIYQNSIDGEELFFKWLNNEIIVKCDRISEHKTIIESFINIQNESKILKRAINERNLKYILDFANKKENDTKILYNLMSIYSGETYTKKYFKHFVWGKNDD